MKITIIHPSRNRPEQAAATVKKWMSSALNRKDIEYILSIDKSEEYENKRKYHDIGVDMLCMDNHSAIDAINVAAKNSKGDLLIVVSDDFDCPFHWDVALLEALEGKTDFIVKTDDGCQPWIITLPIMDRTYYNRFGYIYFPGYKHMFCDTEMTHVADLLGRKIGLPVKFPHMHYTQHGGQPFDEVNKKNNSTWFQGEELYLQRIQNDFGLSPEEVKGTVTNAAHIGWLKSKGAWQMV